MPAAPALGGATPAAGFPAPATAGAALPVASAPVANPTRVVVGNTNHIATSPAGQLGTILIASTRTPAGYQQLAVRLDPPELGHVRVAIAQPRGGPATITLSVERPETLLMVLRDAPALHRALDRAGVPAEARTISFELAPQHEAPPSAQPQSHHGGTAFDLAARDHGQRPRAMAPAPPDRAAEETDATADDRLAYVPLWRRAGIDITA